MGFIRLYLALSVVVIHIYGRALSFTANGYVAVVLFFIISGFYMSLVIGDKYDGMPVWRFYLARAIRLYPAYWTILALAICLAAAGGLAGHWPRSLGQWIETAVSNGAILGIHFANPPTALIPPAWSLSVELQFYILAPFIVARDIRIVVALLILSLVYRFSLLDSDFVIWRYAFAPADACFFMMGVVSHRLSQLINVPRFHRNAGFLAIVALPALAYACDLSVEKDLDVLSLWVFYVAFAAGLPFLFFLTKDSRIDRMVGEVSYPVYVSHWTTIAATLFFLGPRLPEPYVPIVDFLLVLIVAIALTMLVEGPVERFRQRFSRIGSSTRTMNGVSAAAGRELRQPAGL